jgi:CRISPR-associated protein Csx17
MNNIIIKTLSVIRLAGLHLDTLGHYFAALGLLRLAAREWPAVKGCWRNGIFHIVGGPQNLAELESFVLNVGANNQWTRYKINRPENAQSDTPEKKARDLALWLARDTGEIEATLAQSHVAAGQRRDFNPTFGSAGNSGNRNFPKGWRSAVDAIWGNSEFSKALTEKVSKAQDQAIKAMAGATKVGTKKHQDALQRQKNADEMKTLLEAPKLHLSAFLYGELCLLNPSVRLPKASNPKQKETVCFLSDYGAACWFSAANKIYNFSPDKPYREGQITPWAMLLACEAFPLLVGATSRQIGSQRKGTGAFPFVTQGVAPEADKESGIIEGEFWAPVWSKPLALAEISALYKRGRAEVSGRGAITSAAFAAAIIQKGTDAGLAEFRRFSLLHTTSAQTFESRLASVHPLGTDADAAQATAVSRIIRFRDSLPREYKKGTSWIYRGLQGPIDNALVRLASAGRNDGLRAENSWSLLDAVFASLEKSANNKTYREREPQLELLPVSWAVSLLENEREITPELRIALALATLRAEMPNKAAAETKRAMPAPFIAYRIGVVPAWKNNWRKIKIAKRIPLRVVWSQRGFTDNVCAVISRRVAVEAESGTEPPCDTQLNLSLADIFSFLNNETDDALLTCWLDRFLLFDWSFIAPEERGEFSVILKDNSDKRPLLPVEILWTFFRPLFHAYTCKQLGIKDDQKTPTTGFLRSLIALLERGDTAAAYHAAVARYKSLSKATADFGGNAFMLSDTEPRRLLAALLLPPSPAVVAKTFSRWTLPSRSRK